MQKKETSQLIVGHRFPQSLVAFAFAAPIAILGGLIGLGGAEFRLPVLAGPLRYPVRQAVRLNLTVSLITIAASLLTRAQTLSFQSIEPFAPELIMLVIGAGIMAFVGTGLVPRISEQHLERVIFGLLVTIGLALVFEAFLPQALPAIVPNVLAWQIVIGLLLGFAIGLISSVLGVAGGELIIPTLIFGYGMDAKSAGTASLLISLPTVLIGVARYLNQSAFKDREEVTQTIVPMGVGSIIGALIGGLIVGIVPTAWLKISLGIILNISAFRIFHDIRKKQTEQAV